MGMIVLALHALASGMHAQVALCRVADHASAIQQH